MNKGGSLELNLGLLNILDMGLLDVLDMGLLNILNLGLLDILNMLNSSRRGKSNADGGKYLKIKKKHIFKEFIWKLKIEIEV